MDSVLQKIGFTPGEERVYLALIELGQTTTGPLIDASGITSSKVYHILERLEQKGLVSRIVVANVRRYQATNPRRLNDYMKRKKSELEQDSSKIAKLIPQLEEKRNEKLTNDETSLYHGSQGFSAARDDFISDLESGSEYCVFGSEASISGIFVERIRDISIDNQKRGIKTRILFNSKLKKAQELYKDFENVEVRFLSRILPSSMAISQSKVLHMSYGKKPNQVVITSKSIANSMLLFFESLWDEAKGNKNIYI